jgi:hypothetical protein
MPNTPLQPTRFRWRSGGRLSLVIRRRAGILSGGNGQ